jgi:protein phosphatase
MATSNKDNGQGETAVALGMDAAATLRISGKPEDSPEVAGLSDVGMVREFNEDNWHWAPLDDGLTLYAVADGMGGHDSGEVASQLAVEGLFAASRKGLKDLTEPAYDDLQALLRNSFEEANRLVVNTGMEQESNMGTTLCAILVNDSNDVVIGNVGDSRIYLLRSGSLNQISRDHSLVAFLVQLGELTEEEARDHPSGNILVRSIGSMQDVEVDLFHLRSQAGDRILLCSDGLWGELNDDELLSLLLSNENPGDACAALIEAANDNGGRDNSTLIVVNV